ncbi:MAG: ATP-binding cassette domain-containing protein [Methylococcales bacterium]|nr:ATP-binding cassette domain-containing protein [Methylococcales bacterium]
MNTRAASPFESDHRSAILVKLFEFILAELGRSEQFTEHLLHYQGGQASFSETARALNLRINDLRLPLELALACSGPLTPLLSKLPSGDWLICFGYKSGRIKATRISIDSQESLLLSQGDIETLLECSKQSEHDWMLIEDQAPMQGSSDEHHGHLSPLRRLWSMIQIESQDLWQVLWLSIASGLLSLASPAAVQSLVNTVALGGMYQPLLVLSLMLMIFLTFFGFIGILQSYVVELLQRRLFVRMSADMAFRLPHIAWQAGKNPNHVELINRFFDVLTLQKTSQSLLLEGLSTLLQGGIGLLVLAFYHPLLLVFNFVLMLWLLVVTFWLGRNGISSAIQESHGKYALVAWLEVITHNKQSVKFKQGPDFARERTNWLAHAYLNARKRHYRILLRQQIGLYALYAVASTTLLAMGGWLVVEGQLSLGQLVAAELIVSGVLLAFAKFKKQLESFYDLVAGVDKLGYLLDLPTERQHGNDLSTDSTAMSLTVKNLEFAYPGQKPLFGKLNFALPAGQSLAIKLSPSQGQTTLSRLLTGLYTPPEGSVWYEGHALEDWHLPTLRDHVQLLSRFEFFPLSLMENVRLGRDSISANQIRECLQSVGLLQDLTHNKTLSLKTELNEYGGPLTRHQQQKLLLARAIVDRPRLLIIDALFDQWPDFLDSPAYHTLFSPNAPWTLLIITASNAIAQRCQHVIDVMES